MRRSLSLRIATLVFVVFATTSPAFAAGKREDSPIAGIERVIARVMQQIKKVFDVPVLNIPPG